MTTKARDEWVAAFVVDCERGLSKLTPQGRASVAARVKARAPRQRTVEELLSYFCEDSENKDKS